MNKPVIYKVNSDFSNCFTEFNKNKILTCNRSILYMDFPVSNVEFDNKGNGCILIDYNTTISLISLGLNNCINNGALNIKIVEQSKFFYDNKLIKNVDYQTLDECELIVYFTETNAIAKQIIISSFKEDEDNDDLWNEPINKESKLEEINDNELITDNSKKVIILPQPKEIYTTRAKILLDQAKEYESHANELKKQADIIYTSFLK
jgi:hypothetical protein